MAPIQGPPRSPEEGSLVAPLYSTLLQIDPYDDSEIIDDVAAEWKVATGRYAEG